MRFSVLLAASAVVLTLVFTVFCSDDENGGMFAECGDGMLDAGEECDDGNTDPGDGCRASCTLEECGDGILDTGEECDDGNDVACDGCSPQCTIESGWICGDDILNQVCGEECDDGNTASGDGCDANCALENCGDGNLDAGEECDDQNDMACDGCSPQCTIESGWICGDGILNQACGEECDDQNGAACDGCSPQCIVESGWICGDGILNQACGEECDDQNGAACDGCSPQCIIESGWICGDGILNQACGEECDDQNGAACDGCSPQCIIESGWICGDDILNQVCGEECDDGNTVPGDGCDENCQIEPLLVISGDYDLNIVPILDTCGFGASPTNTPMAVNELDPTTVEIDIPIGGVGGDCDRKDFTRAGDTVTRVETIHGQIGACIIQTDVTTQFTFFDDDTVTALETNVIQASGGDCSAVSLPCTVQLEADGARCIGCFACVNPTAGTSGSVLGPLGGGVSKD